ncbi:MAG: hypothetical protein MUE80_01985 [Acidobacteria bacterium]|jgi:hypothetical protein|nr:hypothetical protein [Acidobacteriota bacterium]
MNNTMKQVEAGDPSGDRRQGRRLDEISLALVLVMTGALWLVPKTVLPEGSWLVGLGLIVLGLNAVRRLRGLRASGFGVIIGLVAFAAGIGRIIDRDLPIIPGLLIVLGAGLVIRAAGGGKGRADRPVAS